MGSYDGGEFCELVGLYLLDLLTKESGKQNIGLHRDDGKSKSLWKHIRTWLGNIKKKLFKIFKSNGLSITVECNSLVTDFWMKIRSISATYYSYRKTKQWTTVYEWTFQPRSINN